MEPEQYQVTKWVKSQEEIQFAINQIEKYGAECTVLHDRRGFAVFRPRKDINLRKGYMGET